MCDGFDAPQYTVCDSSAILLPRDPALPSRRLSRQVAGAARASALSLAAEGSSADLHLVDAT